MKKNIYLLLILILSYCTVMPGIDTIDGKTAKTKLIEAASTIDRIGYALIGSPISASLAKALNTMLVPVFISINDGKYYDKASVDDCVKKIKSIEGLILGGATTIPFCDVQEAALLDLGPLDLPEGNKAKVNKDLAMLLTIVGLSTPVPTATGTGAGTGTGVGTGTGSPSRLPIITRFLPTSGTIGTTITIEGSNFAPTASENLVQFDGINALVKSTSFLNNSLEVEVPAGVTTGLISVRVQGQIATSSSNFSIISPEITRFYPISGNIGDIINVDGNGFSPKKENCIVKVNGNPVTVDFSSSNLLSFKIPSGTTSGPISISIDGRIFTSSSNLTVITPTITSFEPTSGIAGQLISIRGAGFSFNTTNNIVKFNGVTATILYSQSASITVEIPTGATSGPITVESGGFTVTSPSNFNVATIRALTLGSAFISGTLQAGMNVYYTAPVIAGKRYAVYFDDSSSGSGAYTADVSVKVLKADKSTTIQSTTISGYMFNSNLWGYFTGAVSETVYIEVTGSNTSSSGTFGIRIAQEATVSNLSQATTNALIGIQCPGDSTTTCVAVGNNGVITRTTDGGVNWSVLTSGTTNPLNGIHCPSSTICYIAGASGTILKSTDAGVTWSALTSGTTTHLYGITCPSTTVCYAVGFSGMLLKTSDGSSWSTLTSGTTNSLNFIKCPTTTTCIVSGDLGTILKTVDGTAWTSLSSGTTNALFGVFAADTNNFIIMNGVASTGTASGHRVTSNGGTTWSSYYMGTNNMLRDVSCSPGSITNCVAIGTFSTIVRTIAGANAWSLSFNNFSDHLYGLTCPTSALCFAVGNNGRTLRITD